MMKGFVVSNIGVALLAAVIVYVLAAAINANLFALYLLCIGATLIWTRIKVGPFETGIPAKLRSVLPIRRHAERHH